MIAFRSRLDAGTAHDWCIDPVQTTIDDVATADDGSQTTAWEMCRPAVWTAVVLVGALAVAALSVPSVSTIYGHGDSRDFIRPEWFVAGGLLAYPMFYAARASWKVLPLVVVLPSVQVLFSADTAVQRLQQAGLGSGSDDIWYVLAVVEILLYVAAGGAGAARNLDERRWRTYVRELAPDHQPGVRRPPHG